MKTLFRVALAVVTLTGPVAAQTGNADLVAVINKFIDSFDKGDAATAAATHAAVPELGITDEVAPYHWTGAKAFATWAGDLEKNDKAEGITEENVKVSAPSRVERTATDAYVVVPAVYSFKQKGVAMKETAQMTFVLKKGATGWMIYSWTWTGPRAKPAPAAAK